MLAVHDTSQCARPAHLGVEHAECRASVLKRYACPKTEHAARYHCCARATQFDAFNSLAGASNKRSYAQSARSQSPSGDGLFGFDKTYVAVTCGPARVVGPEFFTAYGKENNPWTCAQFLKSSSASMHARPPPLQGRVHKRTYHRSRGRTPNTGQPTQYACQTGPPRVARTCAEHACTQGSA